MPPPISFEYGQMRAHYVDRVGTPVHHNDVRVQVISADYVLMKRDQDHTETPFITRNMLVRRLLHDDPFGRDHPDKFGLGGFIVYEPLHDDRARRRRGLFIVTPKVQESRDGNFVAGNHYSFFVNKDARNPHHRLNFHRTVYLGDSEASGCVHNYNKLPLEFLMVDKDSLVDDGLLRNSTMTSSADVIFDILARPWANLRIDDAADSRAAAPAAPAVVRGGGRRRRRRMRRGQTDTIERFDDLWRALPIHRMTVVAIRSKNENGMMDVTVFVEDRFKGHPWRASPAHLFKLSLNDENRGTWEGRLQEEVRRRMAHMEWDDFKDPLEM